MAGKDHNQELMLAFTDNGSRKQYNTDYFTQMCVEAIPT